MRSGETMRTLILSASILGAGGLVAAAVAGRFSFSEDLGTRLRRECRSIVRELGPIFSDDAEAVNACIMSRSGWTSR